jgi:RNA polymerase-binding transcription factor DksA
MTTALTPGQHALLETELRLIRTRLERALSSQLDGQDRVGHATELLDQDPHENREHEADREIDMARSDQLMAELREVDAALSRLGQPGYGRCVSCGIDIPFDRLHRQPQALRCIDCQSAHEAGR